MTIVKLFDKYELDVSKCASEIHDLMKSQLLFLALAENPFVKVKELEPTNKNDYFYLLNFDKPNPSGILISISKCHEPIFWMKNEPISDEIIWSSKS